MSFVEDIGPLEEPPLKVAVWFSLFLHPVSWALGGLFAHRFNDGYRATLPFAANLLPIGGLMGFSVLLHSSEGQAFDWMMVYLGSLILLLVIGIGVGIVFNRIRPTIVEEFANPNRS